jgi:hypothetical protein
MLGLTYQRKGSCKTRAGTQHVVLVASELVHASTIEVFSVSFPMFNRRRLDYVR